MHELRKIIDVSMSGKKRKISAVGNKDNMVPSPPSSQPSNNSAMSAEKEQNNLLFSYTSLPGSSLITDMRRSNPELFTMDSILSG
jgi:hypothetical protein